MSNIIFQSNIFPHWIKKLRVMKYYGIYFVKNKKLSTFGEIEKKIVALMSINNSNFLLQAAGFKVEVPLQNLLIEWYSTSKWLTCTSFWLTALMYLLHTNHLIFKSTNLMLPCIKIMLGHTNIFSCSLDPECSYYNKTVQIIL